MDPTGCFCTLLQPAAYGNRAIKLRIGSDGKDDMQEDETMSSEASEEESHSASGGVGVDEEVSDSSNNNTMRVEDRSRLKAPTQPFPPLLYKNIAYSQVFFQFLPHVIS